MATVFSDTPMSTTSGTSPSATSTCLSTGAICGFANSPGTLYLFTFLSTLLLLTLVSGGIISRSMYLRRRQQRLMASGAWAPPTRRTAMTLEASLRNKPTMYEVNLSLVAPEDLRYWDGMQPLAAAYRRPAARPIPVPAEVAYSVNNPGETRPARTRIFPAARRLLGSTHVEVNPVPPPPEPIVTIPLREIPLNLRLQAAYVIAMPTEHFLSGDDQAWELPFFELGSVEVEVAGSSADSIGDGEDTKMDSGSPM